MTAQVWENNDLHVDIVEYSKKDKITGLVIANYDFPRVTEP